ncbi:MAG: hypothetical protein IIA87_01235 [Nanoarchaeota archaeon]|nr:hypothetical protein [Nanoarchaeota archaeon]
MSEINHEDKRTGEGSSLSGMVADDGPKLEKKRMNKKRNLPMAAVCGVICCWAINGIVYMGLSMGSADRYNKLIEPVVSIARSINQYEQNESTLSEDDRLDLARLRTEIDGLEKELGPSVEAARRDYNGKLYRVAFTPIFAPLYERIIYRGDSKGELPQDNGDREE